MIRRCEVERVLALVHRSHVHDDLEHQLNPSGTGRPRDLRVDVLLAGIILRADPERGVLSLVGVHRLLTRDLPHSLQGQLGIRTHDAPFQRSQPITVRQVRYLVGAIDARLRYTPASTSTDKGLIDADREDREAALWRILDALVAACQPEHVEHTGGYALDGTAVRSWAKGKRRRKMSPSDDPRAPGADDDGPGDDEPSDDGEEFYRYSADLDAMAGYCTKTYHNGRNRFFGYDLFTLASVNDVGADPDEAPKLIERFRLRPAGRDVVEPGLALLDSLGDRRLTEVINDRAWSYKLPARWAAELRRRDVSQVLDLHENDYGVTDHHGIKMIAGTPHCPGTPEHLLDIRRPQHLSVGQLKKSATREEIRDHTARVAALTEFQQRIAERQQYAFTRVTSPDATGKDRWRCPAYAGKVVCDHCPLSQHFPAGLPTITDGPEADTRPTCSRQQTITLPGHVSAKTRQYLYWGSPEWIASFNRRSTVEGQYGNLKSSTLGGLERGWMFLRGLVKTALLIACVIVSLNLRLLRNWAQRTGDVTDPLSRPDPPDPGWEERVVDLTVAQPTGPPLAA